MTRLTDWLGALASDAEGALSAEKDYRADFARRVAELADRRAEAVRRANLLVAVADGVCGAQDQEEAVSRGLAALRVRLGWASDSEARNEIMDHFAPVCAACFVAAAPATEGEDRLPDPASELAAFESWFREARGASFWALFENEIPETPRVDF